MFAIISKCLKSFQIAIGGCDAHTFGTEKLGPVALLGTDELRMSVRNCCFDQRIYDKYNKLRDVEKC